MFEKPIHFIPPLDKGGMFGGIKERIMETPRLKRINELAKKEKEQGLTPEEKLEQQELRAEYLAVFKNNLVSQLENTYIVDEKGNKRKIRKKPENKS